MRYSCLAVVLCACTAAPDPLEPPTGPVQQYVLRSERVPFTNSQAREYGLDLDGRAVNGTREDNGLGLVLSTVAGMGVDVGLDADELVARGDIIQLAELQLAAPSDPDDSVAFSLRAGGNASPMPCADDLDTQCGRHLQGDASFVAEPSAHVPLLGERRDRDIQLGPGSVRVSFSVFGEVVTVDMFGARVRLPDVLPDALVGVIAGGIRHEDINALIVPPFVHTLERLIKAECPTRDVAGCGCPADSEARDWLGVFDTNPRDCAISVDEVAGAPIVQSMTAPDITIDGQPLLSFGFRFEAVSATF